MESKLSYKSDEKSGIRYQRNGFLKLIKASRTNQLRISNLPRALPARLFLHHLASKTSNFTEQQNVMGANNSRVSSMSADALCSCHSIPLSSLEGKHSVSDAETGTALAGSWRLNGVFDGEGSWTSACGTAYTGEFLNGKFHGLGKFTYKCGSTYEGSFNDDCPTEGVLVEADGKTISEVVFDGETSIFEDPAPVSSEPKAAADLDQLARNVSKQSNASKQSAGGDVRAQLADAAAMLQAQPVQTAPSSAKSAEEDEDEEESAPIAEKKMWLGARDSKRVTRERRRSSVCASDVELVALQVALRCSLFTPFP
eukprot:3039866-Rhodomonas_salina.1